CPDRPLGIRHNLFSLGQFCDADLEVEFWKNTCFIWNLEGVDLLLGSRDTNFFTISLDDMLMTSPICLLSKDSKTKRWLWHRRLSHLNFGTLNKLAKEGLARGILKLKFQKYHLCSACALGKSKKSSHQPKINDTNQEKLCLLHMDLCGPMRMESINEKNISHQTSVTRTPQQNGVVERRNRTLVEAARTMTGLQVMTPATSCSRLVPNIIPHQPCNPLKRDDWDTLFQLLFDEYLNPPTIAVSTVPVAAAP
nr:retrovirus-related Pol polyprotein from transposon TNT 1-94 [Tanacetum cinerariifolium]